MLRHRGAVLATVCCVQPLCAQTVSDSAGVRIIDNARPAWTARDQLHLSATPRLVIGDTADATRRFRGVRGVVETNDVARAHLLGGRAIAFAGNLG
jgi:hypothetical protein